jgi:hypothetical protein
MLKTACATIALLAFANPALAAGCATPADSAALKTAVMQQELMVAAFQCRETSAYNRFVMTYRSELQSSDAALKAFFVRRGGEHGEAGYDTFKTKAANLSALEQARNSSAFCSDAHALFTAAFNHQGSLMSFVESRSTDVGNICLESRPVLAKTDTRPDRTPALVAAKPEANIRVAEVAVPSHSLPAIPYRRETRDSDAPRAQERDARDQDLDDAEPFYANEDELPPPPRYYQARNRDAGDFEGRGYAPRPYGPPPGWRPQEPRYGWYPRDSYYGR